MSTSADRLARLLALVPYLLARPGIPLADVADEFGITESTLIDDLQLLFVCGLPGHLPDDLIEASFDGGVIYLSNADTIARPLKLSNDEALALLIGLRLLAGTPVPQQVGASAELLARTMAKLEHAAGEAAAAGESVAVVPVAPSAITTAVQQALTQARQLHLRYYSARRDEVTQRVIDPLRLDVVDGRTYLQAWCHDAAAVRVFRADRIAELRLLDSPREVPEGVTPRDLSTGVYRAGPTDQRVVLEIEPSAQWMIEYYTCKVLAAGPDSMRIALVTPDLGWLVRLVLRHGGAVRPLEPPELVNAVVSHATAGLALNEE